MKSSHIVLIILSVCALAAILYLLTAGNKATKSSITNNRTLLGSETTESYESYDTPDSIDLREENVTNSDAYQTMESDDFEINMPGYTKEQVLNAIKYYVMLSQAGESDIDDQIKSDYRSHLDNFANLIINPLFFILFQLVNQDVNTVFEVRNDDNTTTKYKFVEIDCGDEELCTEDNITNIKLLVDNQILLNENKYQYLDSSNFNYNDFTDQTEITFDTIQHIWCQSDIDDYSARTTCDEGDKTFTGPVYQQVTVSLAQYQEYVTSYSEYLISVLNTDET
tara:strand:+ start:2148 stop:2990 length:843 start_codon:yes stop_codon:yes gene_type:complete